MREAPVSWGYLSKEKFPLTQSTHGSPDVRTKNLLMPRLRHSSSRPAEFASVVANFWVEKSMLYHPFSPPKQSDWLSKMVVT